MSRKFSTGSLEVVQFRLTTWLSSNGEFLGNSSAELHACRRVHLLAVLYMQVCGISVDIPKLAWERP